MTHAKIYHVIYFTITGIYYTCC